VFRNSGYEPQEDTETEEVAGELTTNHTREFQREEFVE
jgi:hypothetical protein